MVHVVIDSTVLRNDPSRKKAAFEVIERLANKGKLKLHIPFFVEQEFLSQEFDIYSASLDKIEKEIKNLQRRLPSTEIENFLAEFQEKFESLQKQMPTFVEAEFKEWVKRLDAVVHPIGESHGVNVAHAYFRGDPPFREKKKREDFPDALIWQTVLDLTTEVNSLCFVSGDKMLLKSCEAHSSITAFANLDDLIASDVGKTLLAAEEAEETEEVVKDNLDRLLKLVSARSDLIASGISNELINLLCGETLKSHKILDDNNEGIVSSVSDPEGISLLIKEAQYYGDGLVVIPFTLSVEALVDYAIDKADWFALDDEESKEISISDLNDHYFSAQEDYMLKVSGILSIHLDVETLQSSNQSEDVLSDMLVDSEIEIDSIESIQIL